MVAKLDIAGHRHGRLEWIRPLRAVPGEKTHWECRCDCGRITRVAIVHRNHTSSCGCLRALIARAMHTTHGLTGTRTWNIWSDMRARCDNPNSNVFQYYGRRGIAYESAWGRIENFVADMGMAPDGLTLDRRDTNGNYSKANCRWATYIEQENNRRNNRIVEHGGNRYTVAELARKCGLRHSTLLRRINRGWPIEQAVILPAARYGKALVAARRSQ